MHFFGQNCRLNQKREGMGVSGGHRAATCSNKSVTEMTLAIDVLLGSVFAPQQPNLHLPAGISELRPKTHRIYLFP